MPRKSKITETKATEPETKAVEAAPVETKPARGAKTAAIQAALKAHKDKSPQGNRGTADGIGSHDDGGPSKQRQVVARQQTQSEGRICRHRRSRCSRRPRRYAISLLRRKQRRN